VLKTQLEVACKLYNTLLHAEQEEYERNKRTMSENELRQLALDLRKQSEEFQALHSQVAQQVADRFYQARQRFLDGVANKPRVKKPHRYLSLVYPQSGWKLSNTREVGQGKNKKRKARLHLSKIGFFTLIVHRELPESQVSQVCVKLYPSGRIYIIFVVEEPEPLGQSSKEPRKAVGVDLGITRLATLSDGRFLENPKPLERSLEKIRIIQKKLSRKRFLSANWLKTKKRLAREYEHVKDFRRDLFFKLGCLLAQDYDLLVLEDLNTEGLIQKGVTRTRRMRLYDSSFSELRRCLEWVFQKQGKTVLAVPSYNSSRECFLCGRINQSLSLEDRVFHCPYCSFTLDRDLNASLVLLKRAGWVPPGVPAELRPLPPLPSLGLKKRRQGGAVKQEAPPSPVDQKFLLQNGCLTLWIP
jgi:putative transposase